MQRFFHLVLILGTLLNLNDLTAQNSNTYLGPSKKIPGNPQLLRVQILVNDDPNPQGVQIVEATFDGKDIPLKPRDIYGFRGQASFQTPPGKYKLRWKVHLDKFAWPRTQSHEEEVTLNGKDLWLQITITGEKASIS